MARSGLGVRGAPQRVQRQCGFRIQRDLVNRRGGERRAGLSIRGEPASAARRGGRGQLPAGDELRLKECAPFTLDHDGVAVEAGRALAGRARGRPRRAAARRAVPPQEPTRGRVARKQAQAYVRCCPAQLTAQALQQSSARPSSSWRSATCSSRTSARPPPR